MQKTPRLHFCNRGVGLDKGISYWCGAILGYNFVRLGSMRDWQSSDVRPITRFEEIDIQANIQALI